MKRDIDILFVGSILPRRENFLNKLQSHFNIKICQAFGTEMSQLFNRAKIVLNIHADEFLDTETRIYEALGCGAFIISEKLSSENPFISGKHLIEVENIDEIKSQISYYLLHNDEREKIAAAGHLEASLNHSYDSRAEELLVTFNKFMGMNKTESYNYTGLMLYSKFEKIRNYIQLHIR